jgi:hypothetical protein
MPAAHRSNNTGENLKLLNEIQHRIDRVLNLARCQDLALMYPDHKPNRDDTEQVDPLLITEVMEHLLMGISDDLSAYLGPRNTRAAFATPAVLRAVDDAQEEGAAG